MSESGPLYGVELIESLPMPGTGGMSQAMPQRDELSRASFNGFERTAAAYEVLLAHWRERGEEIERLRDEFAKIPTTKDGVLVYPGSGVYRVWDIKDGQPYDLPLHYSTDWWGEYDAEELVVTDLVGHAAQLIECYSTLAAAENAILDARKSD